MPADIRKSLPAFSLIPPRTMKDRAQTPKFQMTTCNENACAWKIFMRFGLLESTSATAEKDLLLDLLSHSCTTFSCEGQDKHFEDREKWIREVS